jgi:nucleoside-diphosphate-sugar epimerase
MNKKIKILVIGGTGFIGYHLSKKCIQIGWNVTSVSKSRPKKEKFIKGVKYKRVDLRKYKNVKNINKNFDYVVNSSGYINNNIIKKYNNDHFKILKNLVEHFKKSKIKRFLQIGTSAEYGGKYSPQVETAKCIPRSPYGKDKLNCTNYLLKAYDLFKFPSTIFRIYQAYGPMQDTNRLIPIVAKACFFNKRFDCSDGSQIRDFIYIDDVILSIIKALKCKNTNGQIFNIGSGKKVTIKFLINFIKNFYKKGFPIYGKIKLRKDESKVIYPNIKKSYKFFNFKPNTNLKVNLLKTLKFYKKKYRSY